MSESGRISPIWTVLLPPGKKKRVISLLSKRVLEGASIFPQNGPEGNEKKISERLLKRENVLHRRMLI